MRGSFFILSALFFIGCSQKQYFTPKEVRSASAIKSSDTIKFFSRDGATLESGVALTPKRKLNLRLREGELFLNETKGGVVIATKTKRASIIRGNRREDITLPKPLLAGVIVDDKLIYVLKDNSFGVYNLATKSIQFNDTSQVIYSIDTRVANPIIIDNLAVIPLLNGKVVVFNLDTNRVIQKILISADSALNNVIFLKRFGQDTFIASTPHKIVSIKNRRRNEIKEEISEVKIDGSDIFIFLKDGRVLRADSRLRVQDEKKFKFAHFVVGTTHKNRVYALEKQGYLIVTNRNFTNTNVYKFPEVEWHSFVSGNRIYYDNNIIDLDSI